MALEGELELGIPYDWFESYGGPRKVYYFGEGGGGGDGQVKQGSGGPPRKFL